MRKSIWISSGMIGGFLLLTACGTPTQTAQAPPSSRPSSDRPEGASSGGRQSSDENAADRNSGQSTNDDLTSRDDSESRPETPSENRSSGRSLATNDPVRGGNSGSSNQEDANPAPRGRSIGSTDPLQGSSQGNGNSSSNSNSTSGETETLGSSSGGSSSGGSSSGGSSSGSGTSGSGTSGSGTSGSGTSGNQEDYGRSGRGGSGNSGSGGTEERYGGSGSGGGFGRSGRDDGSSGGRSDRNGSSDQDRSSSRDGSGRSDRGSIGGESPNQNSNSGAGSSETTSTLDAGGSSGGNNGFPAAGTGGGAGAGGATESLGGDGVPGGNTSSESSRNAGSSSNNSPPNNAPQPVAEDSFYNMAINAYQRGESSEGYRYLQAEFAANRERFETAPLGLWATAKRPEIGIRMGVGIDYVTPRGFDGKAPVIGDEVEFGGGGAGGRAGAGGRSGRSSGQSGRSGGSEGLGGGGLGRGAGSGSEVPADARQALEYYGGDMATVLIERLEERFKTKKIYGEMFAGMDVVSSVSSSKPPAQQQQQQSRTSGRRSFGGSGGLDGSDLSGGGASGGGGSNSANGEATGFFPGLTYLGEGSFAELLKLAEKHGLDGLFVLEQKATLARNGVVGSQTRIKFYSVAEGKERGSTSSLYPAKVASDRQGLTDASKDPVEKELNELFDKKVDKTFMISPMPTLTEEQATGRLKSIFSDSKEDPLPFLVEASFYVKQGWLDETAAQEMIIALIGEPDALKLFSGDFQKQKEALSKWMPRSKS